MNFLVIGLGSMGKRRIRCLRSLGFDNIGGFDVRADRREEAARLYGVPVFDNVDAALAAIAPDALIISVPPDLHHPYMQLAIDRNIHFFVEASVMDTGLDCIVSSLQGRAIVAAPSATLMFHPAIRIISELLDRGQLGKISNLLLHSGQFLPDWHSYEAVSEFYVSNPLTGGGREIVPFELTWITRLLGFPQRVCGHFRKTIEIDGAPAIDDTYNCLLDYGNFLASVTVDVVSRHATRRLLINGDKGQLIWDWNQGCVQLYHPDGNRWEQIGYEAGLAQPGYNANIGENMYIDEIRNFIDAITGHADFINSMADDWKVLKLLYAIEESDRSSRQVKFEA